MLIKQRKEKHSRIISSLSLFIYFDTYVYTFNAAPSNPDSAIHRFLSHVIFFNSPDGDKSTSRFSSFFAPLFSH